MAVIEANAFFCVRQGGQALCKVPVRIHLYYNGHLAFLEFKNDKFSLG